jgi:SnoaL-like domain
MTDSLETIVAKQAITDVLYRYCYAVDRIDPDLGAQIWHPGGLAHYEGIFEGTAEDYLNFVFESHRKTDATSHQLTNIAINVEGDRATSESYITACVRANNNDIVVRGRYTDTWSRRDGNWRIDERRYRHDVVQVLPVSEQSIPMAETPSRTPTG